MARMYRLLIINVLSLIAILGCEHRSLAPAPSSQAGSGIRAATPSNDVHGGVKGDDDESRRLAKGNRNDEGDRLGTQVGDTPTKGTVGRFHDVTRATGIDFSYSNGREANEFAIVESLGGGLGMLDYDRDGRLDVMFAGGGTLNNRAIQPRNCGLFRNLGDMHFSPATAAANAASNQFFTHGVSAADFDSDGFQDLAISGYGGVQLLRNQGDGTFASLPPLITNSTEAWSSSLAWADLDNNGHLDLYVTHYVDWSWNKHPRCSGQGNVEREVCAPREFFGVRDVVYFNDGENFRRESESIGLAAEGKGLGVAICDLNNDQRIDIYVANDTVDNFLYLNDGKGKFTESAVLAGVSGDDAGVSTGSMGLAILDANGDQRPDIFVTNFERELNALYRFDGVGLFTHVSRKSGFAAYPAGFVGFGTVALDFDFDGDLDIVVANGHVSYASPHSPFKQKSLAFRHEGEHFERLPEEDYFAQLRTGRGLACGDLNNDGAVDLVFSNLEEPIAVVQTTPPKSPTWTIVRLVGTRSNRDAVSSVIRWRTPDGRMQVHPVVAGGSYLSHSDQRLHLYWTENSAGVSEKPLLEVQWPSGDVEAFEFQPTMENTLIEGSGASATR